MSNCVLKLEHLRKRFGGVEAVKDFSFSIDEGEIVAIIGPNGAGKTTIFNLISKIYQPDEGTLTFNGEDITGLSQIETARRGVARTFQNTRLFEGLNVLDNVKVALDFDGKYSMIEAMFLLPRRWKREKETTRRAQECLKLLNLDQYASVRPSNLPYGIQRRVEIARALVANPKILMLDEPAAGMNPTETHELMEVIRSIRERFQVAILLIEHDMSLVMNVCERLYVLDYGQLIASGTPDDIRRNEKVITAYLGG